MRRLHATRNSMSEEENGLVSLVQLQKKICKLCKALECWVISKNSKRYIYVYIFFKNVVYLFYYQLFCLVQYNMLHVSARYITLGRNRAAAVHICMAKSQKRFLAFGVNTPQSENTYFIFLWASQQRHRNRRWTTITKNSIKKLVYQPSWKKKKWTISE